MFESDSPVAPGDVVRVIGMVLEFRGLTELTRVNNVIVCASGAPVTPAEIILPLDGDPARALQAENDRNRIILDDGDLAANPDPIPFPPPALSATRTLRVGDTVTGAAGVLSFGRSVFGNRGEEAHRVLATAPPRFVARNTRPDGLGLPGSGTMRVAAANLLNYFNGDGQSGGFPTPRGADDAPVDALQGVTEADAARLERAFGIRTVRDLAELQFVRWAQAIVELAEAEE